MLVGSGEGGEPVRLGIVALGVYRLPMRPGQRQAAAGTCGGYITIREGRAVHRGIAAQLVAGRGDERDSESTDGATGEVSRLG